MAIAFAERVLTCVGDEEKKFVVRLAPLEPSGRGEYKCAYQIVGPGVKINRAAYGLDAIQALQCAFVVIGGELAHIERAEGLRFEFAGGDHGFPRP
ncbi:MAG TPA: hypothetical protein VH639_29560 [Bryobacteraceae bacterium]|jgi:hypothetical protein